MCRPCTGGCIEEVPAGKLALLALALGQMQPLRLRRADAGGAERRGFRQGRCRGELLGGHHRPAARGTGHEGGGARARADQRRAQGPAQSLAARHRRRRRRVGDRAGAGGRGASPRGGLLHDARARRADRVSARARSPRSCTLCPTGSAAPRSSERRPRPRWAKTRSDGVLLIDKPAGITSHDVVARRAPRARTACKTGPRGHARPVRDRAVDRAGRQGDESRSAR